MGKTSKSEPVGRDPGGRIRPPLFPGPILSEKRRFLVAYTTGSITWVRCKKEGCKTEIQEDSPSDFCDEHSPENPEQSQIGDFIA